MFKIVFAVLLWSTLCLGVAERSCPVCGMKVKPQDPTSFESVKDEKPVHLCSLSCAHAFHRRFARAPLFSFEWGTGKKTDANTAYFIVDSKNILKEVGFGMPPTVVGFSNKDLAEKTRAKFGDGKVVKGFSQLEQIIR